MLSSFSKTRLLESQVDQFLDLITKGTLCMREGIQSYLSGDDEDFHNRLETVRDYERKADELRRSTESMLYTYSLIPESRADVLQLLEKLDDVIDCANKSVKAVEQVVEAARAFFRSESRLRDCINKVDFYESEADRAGLRLKKQIYQSDLELPRKHHLRYFADSLESLSDMAQVVSEQLAIASIKRLP
jgi:uncharacterized protein Yka (UPF0111/DUF47 family)